MQCLGNKFQALHKSNKRMLSFCPNKNARLIHRAFLSSLFMRMKLCKAVIVSLPLHSDFGDMLSQNTYNLYIQELHLKSIWQALKSRCRYSCIRVQLRLRQQTCKSVPRYFRLPEQFFCLHSANCFEVLQEYLIHKRRVSSCGYKWWTILKLQGLSYRLTTAP